MERIGSSSRYVRLTLSLSGALVALLLATLAFGPIAASAGQGDIATTREYIQANYRLVQLTAAEIGPIEATLRRTRTRVLSECPRAAAGSPQDVDSEQLSNEVIGAMVTSAMHLVEAPASVKFVRVAQRLKWSNPAITHAVHSYVSKALGLVALAQPKLCSDVKSWAASGFQTLPASTAVFAPHFISIWIAPGELPAGLARYETPDERSILRRTNQLERKFTEMEAREVETWGEIMDGLGLFP
jgi:hypothetical protein